MQARALTHLWLQLPLLYKQVRVIFFPWPRAWWCLSVRQHPGDWETLLYDQRMTLQTSCYTIWGRGEPWDCSFIYININQKPNPPSLGRQATDVHFLLLALSGNFFCTLIRQPNVQEFLEFSFGPTYLKPKEALLKASSVLLFRSGCLNILLFCT